MAGTLLYLLVLGVLLIIALAIVLLPVMAVGAYFWKGKWPSRRSPRSSCAAT